MEAAFARAGLAWDAGRDGAMTLLALRATYEPLLDGLAKHLLLTVPGWMPDRGAMDHSERGHRGILARRMIERLVERPAETVSPADPHSSIWRRLRRRLRADV
jgi:hypothetical protein